MRIYDDVDVNALRNSGIREVQLCQGTPRQELGGADLDRWWIAVTPCREDQCHTCGDYA